MSIHRMFTLDIIFRAFAIDIYFNKSKMKREPEVPIMQPIKVDPKV